MKSNSIKALFLDVGGVLLSNGWDTHSREKAAKEFHLDFAEINKRHALTFDTYEIGKITLDEYLNRVVFYESRSFSPDQFKEFMFSQSYAYSEMIELIRSFKQQHALKAVIISNEGRELAQYRLEKFKLKEWIDFFVFSCFVHLRKPDTEIYHIALNMVQVKPQEVIYIDDRPMLAEIAQNLGMKSICHTNVEETKKFLANMTAQLVY